MGDMPFEGDYTFETPPPMVTPERTTPFPPTGARTLHARTTFFYTAMTAGMIMRLIDLSSQHPMAYYDASKNYFNRKVSLQKDIPAKAFWSLTLCDDETRLKLQTPWRFPPASSQS